MRSFLCLFIRDGPASGLHWKNINGSILHIKYKRNSLSRTAYIFFHLILHIYFLYNNFFSIFICILCSYFSFLLVMTQNAIENIRRELLNREAMSRRQFFSLYFLIKRRLIHRFAHSSLDSSLTAFLLARKRKTRPKNTAIKTL